LDEQGFWTKVGFVLLFLVYWLSTITPIRTNKVYRPSVGNPKTLKTSVDPPTIFCAICAELELKKRM
jgi:hypothetical protein